MSIRARRAAFLLPFLLSGCSLFHKEQKPAPQVLVPASTEPKPASQHPDLTSSAVLLPEQPLNQEPASTPASTPKPPAHHKKPKPVATQTAVNTPPAASAGTLSTTPAESTSVSAIGQLSTGDPSDQRRETQDSIATTERSLNSLGRALSDQEQKTAAQIREYIKQARLALLASDVDGATTLAVKAKVLLNELSQ